MQKVYIRGVKGRGAEVIAKLESLGGRNDYGLGGDYDDTIFVINNNGTIVPRFCEDKDTLALMWAGTEIFLDEPIEEPKTTNNLKKNDPVMASRDGIHWDVCLYCGSRNCLLYTSADKQTKEARRFVICFQYIVPVTDFDFNDVESNIKRSVV